ncbi:MAG: ABC transporter ATP-binding protein [Chloroflexota bacterium]|nr:ABC transporter ATP-binding protein [Chloroflexota bacterium]MDE2898033.1 ABC transporter ATP-binding protein [Chloroflexota bacterium]
MSPALRCSHLTKRFAGVTAVNEASLEVETGTLLALLGPSGCGKTTLLRLIAGLERAHHGTIEVAGRTVESDAVHLPPERRQVGLVFQEYALFPHLSVVDNVAFGLPRGPDQAARVEDMLGQVGLDGLGSRMPHELSGGQQQRVALARALAPGPSLIMLDEPFSNLDPALRDGVRREVRRVLRAANATAIIVTHDQEEALSLADEVAVMMDGRILQQARPAELYRRPASRRVAEFVGDINVIDGRAIGRAVVCDLGTISVLDDLYGPADVLIRPEALQLTEDPGGQAVAVSRSFFGHDQMINLRFDSGLRLSSRVGPTFTFRRGARVRVQLSGDVLAFPKAGD